MGPFVAGRSMGAFVAGRIGEANVGVAATGAGGIVKELFRKVKDITTLGSSSPD